jgi:phloretin hydrolase
VGPGRALPFVDGQLTPYLARPLARPDAEALAAIERGPMDPAQALALRDVDRLLDPAPVAVENGWCVLPDGVGYIAVRTPMPDVTGAMVDWWFDWHAHDPDRYRIWHPLAHFDNAHEPSPVPRAKAHWGAVHHPVEDLGTGTQYARIAFRSPSELGMSTDALDHPAVATIVCGEVGDDRLHFRHTIMFHVFLHEGDGVVLRSRFWLGAVVPRPLSLPFVRRRAIGPRVTRALARHCTEEYTNLGSLLPELYDRFGA